MALSNLVSFAVNRDELITASLLDIGAVSLGQAVSAEMIAAVSRKLGMMLKAWEADGLHLWKIRETTLFLEKGVNSYQLGPNSTNHFTVDRPIYKSTLSAAHALAATTINVVTSGASTSPAFSALTVGDHVGIELSDHSVQWTTVATIPNTTSFTIAAPGLTAAAISGATVYGYTNRATRPLAVYDLMRRNKLEQDVPINLISRNQYYTFGNKNTLGTPTNVFFNPSTISGTGNAMANKAIGSQSSEIRTYVAPGVGTDRLVFNATYPVMDMTSAAIDFDCPQEWLLAIQTNLSVLMGPTNAISMEQFNIIKSIAKEEKERVLGYDREYTSMMLQPAPNYSEK